MKEDKISLKDNTPALFFAAYYEIKMTSRALYDSPLMYGSLAELKANGYVLVQDEGCDGIEPDVKILNATEFTSMFNEPPDILWITPNSGYTRADLTWPQVISPDAFCHSAGLESRFTLRSRREKFNCLLPPSSWPAIPTSANLPTGPFSFPKERQGRFGAIKVQAWKTTLKWSSGLWLIGLVSPILRIADDDPNSLICGFLLQ